MNTGIGLGILALAQLVIAWASDRSLELVDKPLFADQVRQYQPLKIEEFFTEQAPNNLGDMRIQEVLRLARLASAARAAVTALVVSLISLVGTGILVERASPPPVAKNVWLASLTVMAVIVATATFRLMARIGAHDLSAHATTHNEMRPGGLEPKGRFGRYWARLRSPETLNRYLTVAFIGAVVAIAAAIGLTATA